MKRRFRQPLAAASVAALLVASCGGSSDNAEPIVDTTTADTSASEATTPASAPGIRLVSAEDGAHIQTSPPDGLVILDVRTAEEFADGHLEGALMIDFYGDDFADQVAGLDPNVPYLLYCRSGNRSGQTAALMSDLGFTDVADIDGGILSWGEAGLPTVTE